MMIAILGGIALYPLDGLIHGWAMSLRGSLGGDVRRELEMLQQFGGLSSCVIVGLVIWLTMPRARASLRWLVIAWLATGGVVQVLKMFIGRPRPKFEDPETLLGPFGAYPIGQGEGIWHAWQVWGPISSDLWSMPSSHTSAAVVLATYLAWVQPRLRVMAMFLAGLVACARILFGAHWASDVVVGAMVGVAVTGLVLSRAERPAEAHV